MVIFDERGDQIIERSGVYYLRSDLGHIVEEFVEIEISKEDAEKVMTDDTYSTKLVWDYRNKKRGLV